MVAMDYDDAAACRRFVLRPNVAVNWRQTLRLFLIAAIGYLCMGIAFAVVGLWPVLPLSGLELAALGAALYVTARRGHEAQVIRIFADVVEIEKGWRRPERHWRLDRIWSEVVLCEPSPPWYPRRLVIRSRGEQVELGDFLSEEERADLARELHRWIGPMAATRADPQAPAPIG